MNFESGIGAAQIEDGNPLLDGGVEDRRSKRNLIILALARPFKDALALVQVIALPMILANSAGSACSVNVLPVTVHVM